MQKVYDDAKTYKRLLAYILPYKFRLLSAFILLSAASAAHAAISIVTYITINGLMNKTQVTFADIPNLPEALAQISFSAKWVPVIIVVVFLVRGLLEYFSKYVMATTGFRALMDIRNDLYSHLSYLSCDFYSKWRAGDLMSRIMSDVNSINSAITNIVADSVKSPLVILWSLPCIFILGGKLALISVAVFPLVAIPIIVLGSRLRKLSRKMMERHSDITSFMQESFIGMRIIKAFAVEEREIQRFKTINKSVYDYDRKSIRVTEIQRPIIEIMGAVGIAITISYAMKILTADRFMAFTAALFLLYEPFKKLSRINAVMQRALASGNRIFEIMDAPNTIQDCDSPIILSSTITDIEYKNVDFSYEEEKQILFDFNLKIKSGEVVAFVGSSGAGKTTVVNLLLRFYDPNAGSVCINGTDIRQYSLSSIRNQIGLVTQETILFNMTVRDNIAYGNLKASQEEIERAAKAAHAHDFILNKLENGYDTKIGERGMLLSGGQRQRICIARAILKNPPILVFDEATSQLDSESEREVQSAIENLVKGRTVFVIAHRLSTIKNANKIVVLDEGRIVEQGDHASLLAKNGYYKKFHDIQLGGGQPEVQKKGNIFGRFFK
ncbi:MAG: ABC transporter ATP-binding protein [Candidatus Omnitrophica bacterium]|nr:ABC transporter ATP-binding protein [Candidatus Omnitrophota bacterium]